jgi:hypothetical protein
MQQPSTRQQQAAAACGMQMRKKACGMQMRKQGAMQM